MSGDGQRVTVSTYVPQSQRERWREHAEELGMSQSEFVRTMVQAGRRGFTFDGETDVVEEADSRGPTPRGDGLKTAVQGILREEGPLDWDELADALADDLEDRLESILDDLQTDNRVRYDGRRGGFELLEAANGD